MKRASLLLIATLLGGLALAAGPTTQAVRWAFKGGLSIGSGSVDDTAANRITKAHGASATVNFTSTTVGRLESSAITVTGAAVGDVCVVGTTAAGGALPAQYSCYVSAADTVKIVFEPLSYYRAAVALSSGTPSTATAEVPLNSLCTCAPRGTTAAIAAAGCATSIADDLDGGVGTLTLTGPNTVTTTVVYDCAAPVDPASGTFYVRTFSAQ